MDRDQSPRWQLWPGVEVETEVVLEAEAEADVELSPELEQLHLLERLYIG